MSPSFSGAFDLSKLKPSQPQAPAASGNSAPQIPDYLVSGNESTLRSYLQLSTQVVVLLLFTDPRDPELVELRADLTSAMQKLNGQVIGLEIATSSNPQLAQAVGVSATPSVVAVIGGQPAPLFQGRPDTVSLDALLQQVLQLAQQNGVTGSVSVNPQPQPSKTPATAPQAALTPAHQSALGAFERGDLAGAETAYLAILREFPNDQDAKIGLAQSQFLARIQNADPAATGLMANLQQADLLYAAGELAAAFNLLLDEFVTADPDARNQLKDRLIQFFLIAGDDDSEVLRARRRLSSLLF